MIKKKKNKNSKKKDWMGIHSMDGALMWAKTCDPLPLGLKPTLLLIEHQDLP